ncbi:hypothetical protein [Marisediminicola senii]|uniref:hypothetical protein n=1 Tax=Marisediminicola senii TaxID=2711233 RepID=UPI0013ED6B95|nr:hypothetical protein [Marisediminicola senii]
MRFYSDYPAARTAQIAADIVAVTIVVASIVSGWAVYSFVRVFADLGAQLEGAGSEFRATMADAADAVDDIPFVGGGVRAPFDDASDAGAVLQAAGIDQQAMVQQVAVALGLLVAVIPILLVLRYLVVRRIRFSREAGTVAALCTTPAGVELLALRALVGADSSAVLAVAAEPVPAWTAGDPRVIGALAAITARQAGVRMR